MVSVLVLGSSTATGRPPTTGDAVRTLSALVPATVDGVVRDVNLLATGSAPDLLNVAEHAGCGFIDGANLGAVLRAGAAQARTARILVLLAGVSFDRAFADEMAGIEARHDGWISTGIALRAVESGLLGRTLPRFAPLVGLLTIRERLAVRQASNVSALWRVLRPQRSFKTRAWTGRD